MKLPTTLSTSFGIELSYLPAQVQQVINMARNMGLDEEITEQLYKTQNDACVGAYRDILRHVLDKEKIEVAACKTDPGCVEVPTKPYMSANKLYKNISAITRHAKMIGLTPTVEFSVGGGAHIHTGLPFTTLGPMDTGWSNESTDQTRIYKVVLCAWQAANPWFAWAFAGCNDFENAQTITREAMNCRISEDTNKKNIAKVRRDITNAQNYADQYYKEAVRYDELAHAKTTGTFDWYMRESRDYAVMALRKRRNVKLYTAQLNELLTLGEKEPEYFIMYGDLKTPQSKEYAIVERENTMEFRCFIMPPTNTGLAKQIMVTDRIVARAMEETQLMHETGFYDIDMRTLKTEQECHAMTYSAAKRGFIAMLESLGLDPKDYREYRMNMVKRFKVRRMKAANGRKLL